MTEYTLKIAGLF